MAAVGIAIPSARAESSTAPTRMVEASEDALPDQFPVRISFGDPGYIGLSGDFLFATRFCKMRRSWRVGPRNTSSAAAPLPQLVRCPLRVPWGVQAEDLREDCSWAAYGPYGRGPRRLVDSSTQEGSSTLDALCSTRTPRRRFSRARPRSAGWQRLWGRPKLKGRRRHLFEAGSLSL